MTLDVDTALFNPALLELRQAGCTRGGRRLFGALTLQLAAGQWLRVSGENGSGKSSLLRMLCGLLPPSEGAVLWRGQPLAQARDRLARDLVYLGHAAALKEDLTPLENLSATCALGGQAVAPAAALDALREAGLAGREQVPVRRLSQGQRRRCALARLPLARHRPLWILDEPFNALDAAACDWLGRQLRAHLARGGLAVVTSHQGNALEALPHQWLQL